MINIKKVILFIAFIILLSGVNVFATTVGEKLEQPDVGWQRYDDKDSRFAYDGEWSIENLAGHYEGSNHNIIANESNKIEIKFKGSKLRIIADMFSNKCTQVQIKIDGSVAGVYSQYTDIPIGLTQGLVYEVTGLTNDVHTVEIMGLDEGYFTLDAIDIDENGSLLDANKPESPTNLIATASIQDIILTWDAVSGADSYSILRSTTSDTIDTVIAINVTETTYVDTDVEPGVTYYYVVRAVKRNIVSEDSNIASSRIENTNVAILQIKLSTTDIYEYQMTMSEVDDFMNWYIARLNGTGLPFYRFTDKENIEPYSDVNEYIIHDKIVWFKVKEYLNK